MSDGATGPVADGFPPEPWRQAAVPPEGPTGDLTFTCPRCGDASHATTYGPCASCRTDLRARLGGEARTLDEADYIPKVNVTPNAVAVKE